MAVNKCAFIGNLGKDPEIKTFGNGNRAVSFSIAVTERYRDRDGERKEKTEWIPIVIYNENLCQIAEDYLRKGSKVYVEGKFVTRKWEKNGEDRYITEIQLNQYGATLELLSSRDGDDGGNRGGGRSSGGREDDGGGYRERGGGRSGGGGGSFGRTSGGGGGGGGSRRSSSHLDDDIPFAPEFR